MELRFDSDDLKPIVRSVVAELADRFDDGRIAYTEVEAAELVGVARHVLREARLRGEVQHGRIGAKIVYTKRQLLAFLEGGEDS